jgi:hypothetical protein
VAIAIEDACLPDGTCFGCGPVNLVGVRLKCHWSDDGQHVVARVEPDARFTSGFEGVMYGGAVASLIDCHSNWTALAFRYRAEGREPGTEPLIVSATGTLWVRYLRPTPLDRPVDLRAWVEGEPGGKTRVLCEVSADSAVTAHGDSVFIDVDPALVERRRPG